MKLKYDEQIRQWETMPDNSSEGIYLDGFLKEKLDRIPKIIKNNFDVILIIDGKERTGKSTLALTIGTYLQPNLSVNNICQSLEEAVEKIERKAGKLGLTVSAFLRFLGVSAKTPLELH